MKSRETGLAPIIILLIVVVLLAVGGYFYLNYRGSVKVGGPAATVQKTGGNVFTSIQDALSKSLTLKCEYPDAKGRTVTTYIKAGKVRVVGMSGNGNEGYGEALMRDNKMYIWDGTKKQGLVMSFNVEEMKNTAEAMKGKTTAQQPTPNQGANYLAEIEKYKNYCKTASVGDSIFTVPSDVKFVDLAEQMKNSGVDVQKMMQQFQKETPQVTPSE